MLAILVAIGIPVILVMPCNQLRRSRESVVKAAADLNNARRRRKNLASEINDILRQYGLDEKDVMIQAAGADAEMTPTLGGAYLSYSQIAAGVSERSAKVAVYGKSRIDSALGRDEKQGDSEDPRP